MAGILHRPRRPQAHAWGFDAVEILAVEGGRDVTGQLAALEFLVEGVQHGFLDAVAAVGVDGVGDVGVELEAAVAVAVAILVALVAVLVEARATLVAVAGAEVIFFTAAVAMVGELSRRHGKEEAVVAVDELDVADDEGVVEGQGAERLEPVVLVFAELNSDVRQLHDEPLSERRPLKMRIQDVFPHARATRSVRSDASF